jgi:YHS domain-containing protein
MERDPVCGMEVEDTPDTLRTVHEGRSYYFCSESCRDRFEAAPGDFTGGSGETM